MNMMFAANGKKVKRSKGVCQVNCVMQHNSALVREQLGDNPERLFLGVCQVNCVMQHNSALVREQLGDNPERLFLGYVK